MNGSPKELLRILSLDIKRGLLRTFTNHNLSPEKKIPKHFSSEEIYVFVK